MISERLQNFLDLHRVLYTHTTHRTAYTAREVAVADHDSPWEVAKTVVFVGDDAVGMAVLPSTTVVDLERLRHALGLRVIRLATEAELSKLFPDVELGAMPPFGNLYGDIPVYMDRTLAIEEEVAFNAGTHRDVVHMKVKDFKHLAHPTLISFALPK